MIDDRRTPLVLHEIRNFVRHHAGDERWDADRRTCLGVAIDTDVISWKGSFMRLFMRLRDESGGTRAESSDDSPLDAEIGPENPSTMLNADGLGVVRLRAVVSGGASPYEYEWQRADTSETFAPILGGTSSTLNLPVVSTDVTARFRVHVSDSSEPMKRVDSTPVNVEISSAEAEAPEVWPPYFAWVAATALSAVCVVLTFPLWLAIWHSHTDATKVPSIVDLYLLLMGTFAALAGIYVILLEYRGHAVAMKHAVTALSLARGVIHWISQHHVHVHLPRTALLRGRGFKAESITLDDLKHAGVSDAPGTDAAAAGSTEAAVGAAVGGAIGAVASSLAPGITAFGKLKASAALLITAILLFGAGAALAWHGL